MGCNWTNLCMGCTRCSGAKAGHSSLTFLTWMDRTASTFGESVFPRSLTTTTRSPFDTRPRARSSLNVRSTFSSALGVRSIRMGMRPWARFIFRLTWLQLVKANMGQSGRCLDSKDAMYPRRVNTKMAEAPSSSASLAAAAQICSEFFSASVSCRSCRSTSPKSFCRHHSSTRSAVLRMTSKALPGWHPIADSPESIRASLFCLTASAMSATSARVGVGNSSMDCRK
mmetsp:Transcript_31058/g.87033  ORF Transcript_31058/g.87033 Transcript_31058/m.87033 type:complete len:227 (+) Transcript_31058:1077-1757(+)